MGEAGARIAPEAAAIVDAAGDHVPGLLVRVESRLGEIATSRGGLLAQYAGETIAAGGKRLRPVLVIVAAGPETGWADGADDAIVRAAVAVELVHSATLVHDDVLDASAVRRGQPTVWAGAGREAAIATGDFLFAGAFAELTENGDAEQLRVLSRASSSLAEGELLQRADAWDATVPLARYLHRCELKTARLFEAACALGVLAATGDSVRAGRLVDFGRRIGLAFQLLDDVLDVSGPVEKTGKPRGTDLLDGTVTLPLLLARERDSGLAALDVRAIQTPEKAAEICDAIAATGALDDARAHALGLVAEAKAGLGPELEASQLGALELVADGVVERFA